MSLDPRKLRDEARALRAEADQREREARILVQHLRDQASLKERTAELLEEGERLPKGKQSVNPVGVVTTREGLRVSMRTIASAVGISHVSLHQARKGQKRIRRDIAEKVAAISPQLPATRSTWPKGFVGED